MPARLPCLLLLALVLPLSACDGPEGEDFADPTRISSPAPSPDVPLHAVHVRVPETLGVLETGRVDLHGAPIGIPCATCHSAAGTTAFADGDAEPGEPEALHRAVVLQHGTLSCNHCHDPADRSQLRLADGSALAFEDTFELCAQCHGPQTRDYRRGSHGGMNGHWDLRVGDRTRMHCADCHNPHAPARGQVLPVLPPRDRYFPRDAPEAHP